MPARSNSKSKLSRRKFLLGSAATAAGVAVTVNSDRASAFFNTFGFMKKSAGSGQTSNGYTIGQSLRFNANNSTYLSRAFSSSGSAKTFRLVFSLKIASLSSNFFGLFSAQTDDYNKFRVIINNNILTVDNYAGAGSYVATMLASTPMAFRDPSSWYLIEIQIDTTQATTANRLQVWVNGASQSMNVSTVPAQNSTVWWNNSSAAHDVGRAMGGGSWSHVDAYFAEVLHLDGYYSSSPICGQIDSNSGQWIPKSFSGAYGTNGFYLKFADNSNVTASTLGKDSSGNGNNWTPNGFNTYDQALDSPTNNYCTLNPFDHGYLASGYNGVKFSNGNLTVTADLNSEYGTIVRGTIGASSGKWYWRAQCSAGTNGYVVAIGVHDESPLNQTTQQLPGYVNDPSGGWAWYGGWGWGGEAGPKLYHNGTASILPSVQYYQGGDWVEIALDMDAGKLWFGKNGTWSGNPAIGTGEAFSGLSGTIFPCACAMSNSSHGRGAWTFDFQGGTPPSGFKSLSTANLPSPTIKSARQHFNIALDTGADIKATSESFHTHFFEWIKDRNNAGNHQLIDSVRGASNVLRTNIQTGETTYAAPSGASVGWVWNLANSPSANNAGTIPTIVAANQTAGISIITWNGTGAAGSIGHGLGTAPKFFFLHKRSPAANTNNWPVWISGVTQYGEYLYLDQTAGKVSSWNWLSTIDSTKITWGSDGQAWDATNASGCTYWMAAFAEVAGFSKFGAYTGNGNPDGPFVYCGFKPRYIMIKRTDSVSISGSGAWMIVDSLRYPGNGVSAGMPEVMASSANAETNFSFGSGGGAIDILSNGFKCRGDYQDENASGGTFIFAAFAEAPFKYANAR